jgi:hypothetical protein
MYYSLKGNMRLPFIDSDLLEVYFTAGFTVYDISISRLSDVY